MRQIIYFLVVLGLAVVIGLFLAHVGRFSVAVPLWLLLIFLFILAVVLMLLRRIVRRVLIVPQKLKNNLEILRQRQKMRKKIDAIEAGIKRVAKAQP